MSFFGGGTDMPSFFNEYGGSVISSTFDKYAYVNVRHLPHIMPYYSELISSRVERVNSIWRPEYNCFCCQSIQRTPHSYPS